MDLQNALDVSGLGLGAELLERIGDGGGEAGLGLGAEGRLRLSRL